MLVYLWFKWKLLCSRGNLYRYVVIGGSNIWACWWNYLCYHSNESYWVALFRRTRFYSGPGSVVTTGSNWNWATISIYHCWRGEEAIKKPQNVMGNLKFHPPPPPSPLTLSCCSLCYLKPQFWTCTEKKIHKCVFSKPLFCASKYAKIICITIYESYVLLGETEIPHACARSLFNSLVLIYWARGHTGDRTKEIPRLHRDATRR